MKDYAYYIPGYTGFCPDLKEHFGQTYGRATRYILKEKPHLKERLAPVFYKPGRWNKNLKHLGTLKQHDGDGDECGSHTGAKDNKMQCGTECDLKGHRHDYASQKERKLRIRKQHERCIPDYIKEKNDKPRFSFQDQKKTKPGNNGDGDIMRKPHHYCYCPSYLYVQSIAECCPMRWDPQEGADTYHVHYPSESMHIPRTCHEHSGSLGANIDKHSHNKMRRVPWIKPHREGGVIPKYTGHIPGLLFSFGEAYGPASGRLLRRHHDNMNELSTK